MDDNLAKEIQKSFILHWNYRNLTNLPDELRYHGHHIEDIYLKGNLISQMPNWIIELNNLVEIHLSGNYLTHLPEEISTLKLLQLIDVNQNQIKTLPKSFTDLKNLTHFSADDNHLSYLPCDIGRLTSLILLSVAKNNLQQVPDSISECISLQDINLDHNEILYLPKSMVYLPNLSYISLQNNSLQYLPNIPFYSEPAISIRNNDLTYLSVSFARYLKRKHVPPIQEYNDWNFHCARLNTRHKLYNHSIIHSEANNTHIFPLQHIYPPMFFTAPSLYELTLRKIYASSYHIRDQQRIRYNQALAFEILPNLIKKDITSGPTALCDGCNNFLYDYTIIKIFKVASSITNMELINFYCNLSCATKLTNVRELPIVFDIRWIPCEK